MSFQRYLRISSKVQAAPGRQEKTAIIDGLADLAKQLSSAFAAAGQAPGRPQPPSPYPNAGRLGGVADTAMRLENLTSGLGGIDPGAMRDAISLARDEGALRQKAFENQMSLLQMEQGQSQQQIQNALNLGKYQLDQGRDLRDQAAHQWMASRQGRDIEAHGMAKDRSGREAERHGLEMQRLQNELAPGKWFDGKGMFGADSSFQNSLGSSLGGGIGEMITSPLSGISKGVETALAAPGSTFGYRLDRMLNNGMGGLMNRIKAPDIAAERFIESAAGNMADKATDLLADMTSKAMSSLTDAMVNSPARKAILDQLRKEDPIISQMGEQDLMDAYHSIAKYAPTLATDKNAVRSALRQAAQFEGGLDYMTIKGLAEAEAAVTDKKR